MKNWYILLAVLGVLTFHPLESEAQESPVDLFQPVIIAATSAELVVNKTGDGTGRVISKPAGISCGTDCSQRFPRKAKVTLTATENSGSFMGWSGGCSGTKPTCTVTMDEAKNVTATFALKTLVREDGLWYGTHNGDRPTFYFKHYMKDYPRTFTAVLVNCEKVTVINDGHRFESSKLILKQSDVAGRGMALTTQARGCLGSSYNKAYIEYYKEDMPNTNPPDLSWW
ncbi:MAG: hypothetical protein M8357_10255 [Desulfobulbaceae bacterium]|nr:hypothetical protein [Desulfobulbaceae bacterium]